MSEKKFNQIVHIPLEHEFIQTIRHYSDGEIYQEISLKQIERPIECISEIEIINASSNFPKQQNFVSSDSTVKISETLSHVSQIPQMSSQTLSTQSSLTSTEENKVKILLVQEAIEESKTYSFQEFLKLYVISEPDKWMPFPDKINLDSDSMKNFLKKNRILCNKVCILNQFKYQFMKLGASAYVFSLLEENDKQHVKNLYDNIRKIEFDYGHRYKKLYSIDDKFENYNDFEIIADFIYYSITNSEELKFMDFLQEYKDKYNFNSLNSFLKCENLQLKYKSYIIDHILIDYSYNQSIKK